MHAVLKTYLDKGKLVVPIIEFCKMMDWTHPTYYKMRELGLTPKEIRFPGTNIVRISIEELDRWMTERENPGKAERIAIAKQKAKLKLSSDVANAHKGKQKQEA